MGETGLIINGGGFSGVFAIGVVDYLLEQGFEFNLIIGNSIGSCIATSIVSKQKDRNRAMIEAYISSKERTLLRTLLRKRSLLDYDYLFNKNHKDVKFDHDTFKNSKQKFYIMVTSLDTGKVEFIEKNHVKNIHNLVRASCAIPLLSRPVEINNKLYIDGGIGYNTSIRFASSLGMDKIIIINNSTRDKGSPLSFYFQKLYGSLLERIDPSYSQINEVFQNRERHSRMYDMEISKGIKHNKIYVIEPTTTYPIHTLTLDKKILDDYYQHGYETARNKYKDIIRFLNNKGN